MKTSKFFINSISDPKIAIMPPFPLGNAVCIAFPLCFNNFNVCSKLIDSAQHKAEYSTKECPA